MIASKRAGLLLTFVSAVLLTGCRFGKMYVTKHNQLTKTDLQTGLRIVSIEPDVNLTKGFGVDAESKLIESYFKELQLIEVVEDAGSACGMEMVVLDHRNTKLDADYFNFLAPLKQEILLAFFSQLEKLDDSKRSKANEFGLTPSIMMLDWGAELQQQYSGLSEKYNTPYFSFQGIYRVSKSMFFVNIVCDLDMGEVVFSDLRMLKQKPNPGNLYSLVYDSFNLFVNKN